MVYISSLSPNLQKKALEELHEDPNRRDEDIEHIRNWLLKQPHINARTDDWNILRFLRGCKFSLEKTKEKLDMFYTCKQMVPEWYENRDPLDPKTRSILELGEFLPLPGTDAEGRKVIIIRGSAHNPNDTTMDEVFKATHMVYDVMAQEDIEQSVAGVVQIIDLKGSTGSHALQMTPALIKKAMIIWQDGYPIRMKGIHYINTPATFEAIFNIFRTFMKDKMRKRVNVHGNNMESLHKHVPKDILPKEYGGTNSTVDQLTKFWLEKVISKRDWLIEDEKYKVDESKRPGKPKTTTDLFGLEGSFRKLNVD